MISKNQTFEILTLITDFYDQFDITQSKIDSWYLILKNEDLDTIKNNLLSHCKNNIYPPKVADLVKPKVLDRMSSIPNVQETRHYLDSLIIKIDFTDEQLKSIEDSKSKIREILGIR
jgi:hypothetical protein